MGCDCPSHVCENANGDGFLGQERAGVNLASNRLWRKNIVAVTGQDEFYTYDGLSQLTDFQRGTLNANDTGLTGTPAWEEDFTFDPTGNWQQYVNQVNGQVTLDQARTHNPVNEILTIGGSGSLIQQDPAGNIIKAPQPANWSKAYTLTYDAWNRLVQVKNGSKLVATYAYDGQNWRITKTAGNTTRDYYYTSQWQIVEEQVTAGTPDRQYVWGLLGSDNLVLRDRPALNERFYAFSDTVSVTAIADANGNVQERYGYNAYGTPLFMTPAFVLLASSQFDWRTLYDSYHYDGESGFYQVRNRYLHPALGRWLIRDPLEQMATLEGADVFIKVLEIIGLNLYEYVENNPFNNYDPLGLSGGKGNIGQARCCLKTELMATYCYGGIWACIVAYFNEYTLVAATLIGDATGVTAIVYPPGAYVSVATNVYDLGIAFEGLVLCTTKTVCLKRTGGQFQGDLHCD